MRNHFIFEILISLLAIFTYLKSISIFKKYHLKKSVPKTWRWPRRLPFSSVGRCDASAKEHFFMKLLHFLLRFFLLHTPTTAGSRRLQTNTAI